MAHPEGHPLQAFRPEDIAAMTEMLSTERNSLDALQQRINGLFIHAQPLSAEMLQGLKAVSGQLDRFFSVSPERITQLERDIQIYQEKIRELESFPKMKEQHARLLEKRRNELSQSHASTQVADAGQATSETSAILERLGAKKTDQKKKATSHYQVAIVEERRVHQRNNEEDVYHTAKRFLEFLTQPPYRRRGVVILQEDDIRNPDALLERYIREAQEDVDQQLLELRLLLQSKVQEHKNMIDGANGSFDRTHLLKSLLSAGEKLEALPSLHPTLLEILSASRICRQNIAVVLDNLQHSIPTLTTPEKPHLSKIPEFQDLQKKLEQVTRALSSQKAASEQNRREVLERHSSDQAQIETLHRMLEDNISAARVFRGQVVAEMTQLKREAERGQMKAEKLSHLLSREQGRAEQLQEQLSMATMKISVLEAQKKVQSSTDIEALHAIDEQLQGEQLRAAQAEQKLERARSRAKALQASLEEHQGLYQQAREEVQEASHTIEDQQGLLNDAREFFKLFQELNAQQQQFILSEYQLFDHLFKALEELPRSRELLRGARLKLQEQFRRGDQAETKTRALENIIGEQRKHFDELLEEAQAMTVQAEMRLNDEEMKTSDLQAKVEYQGSELESYRDQVLVLQGEKDQADAKRMEAEQLLKDAGVEDDSIGYAKPPVSPSRAERKKDLLHRLNDALRTKSEEVNSLKSNLLNLSEVHERERDQMDRQVAEKEKEIESLKRHMEAFKVGLSRSKEELRDVQRAYIGEKELRIKVEERTVVLAHSLEQAEMGLESHFNSTIRSKILTLMELGKDLNLSTEDFEKLLSAVLPINILKDLSDNIHSKHLVFGFGRNPYEILEEVINDPSLSQRYRKTTLSFRAGLNIQKQLEVALKAFSKIRKPTGSSYNLQKYDINDRALEHLQEHLSERDFTDVLKKAGKISHFDNTFHMDRFLHMTEDFASFLPRAILSEVENHMGSLLNESGSKVR